MITRKDVTTVRFRFDFKFSAGYSHKEECFEIKKKYADSLCKLEDLRYKIKEDLLKFDKRLGKKSFEKNQALIFFLGVFLNKV